MGGSGGLLLTVFVLSTPRFLAKFFEVVNEDNEISLCFALLVQVTETFFGFVHMFSPKIFYTYSLRFLLRILS